LLDVGSVARASRVGDVARGFTLIEGLVVVVILLVSGTLAGVVLDRLIVRARTAEAMAMLREISGREHAFEATGGRFLPLRADGSLATAPADEASAGFYPVPADSPALAPGRVVGRIDDQARWPAAWRTIGVRPRTAFTYCTYLVNAGEGAVPSNLRFGAALLAGAPPGRWFYALAACNLAGRAGYPDEVTVFGVSSQSPEVRTFNRGK
jgi:prepilin-type N-terminal cleavage/methylation domain-containing protein